MAGADKMSKSLRNFVTMAEMLERSDPRAYRLLVLRSQYRSQIDVTPDTVSDAEKALDRLDSFARRFGLEDLGGLGQAALGPDAGPADVVTEEVDRFRAHMDDDLDTPGALARIFDAIGRAHALADAGDENRALELAHTVALLCGVLGLGLVAGEAELDEATRRLVDERDAARAEGDYAPLGLDP